MDIYKEFTMMNCKEIMENLKNAKNLEEKKFYAGLFNLKSKFIFESGFDGVIVGKESE